MPYPGRPILQALPEFKGTATTRQTAQQRQRLLQFCATEYRAGRSIHELAELTDRSQGAIRRALSQAGIQLRGRGAYPIERNSQDATKADPY